MNRAIHISEHFVDEESAKLGRFGPHPINDAWPILKETASQQSPVYLIQNAHLTSAQFLELTAPFLKDGGETILPGLVKSRVVNTLSDFHMEILRVNLFITGHLNILFPFKRADLGLRKLTSLWPKCASYTKTRLPSTKTEINDPMLGIKNVDSFLERLSEALKSEELLAGFSHEGEPLMIFSETSV